jgi:hypothetical protein
VTAAALRLRYAGPDGSAGPTTQLSQLIEELRTGEQQTARLDIKA